MSAHKRIRLLACDLDGTLIGPNDAGLDAAKEAVSLAKLAGVTVTIATGRVWSAAERYVELLGVSAPVITNGGAIVGESGKPSMIQKTIPRDSLALLVHSLRRLALPFYVCTKEGLYTEWTGQETVQYSKMIKYPIEVVRNLLSENIASTQVVVRSSEAEASELIKMFGEWSISGVTVLRSMPHLLEFQAKGVSKSSALSALARSCGFGPHEVLAVGDSLNDLDMLLWAGNSAAVANAHPEVALKCAVQSRSFYGEGVLEIVKKFLGMRSLTE